MKNEILKPFLAGEFISSDEELVVTNPYDDSVVAKTFFCNREIIDEAIVRGVEAKTKTREMPSWRRYEILRYTSDRIRQDRERLALILAMESGKPFRYAIGEIDRATQTFLVAAEESKRISGEIISLDWTPRGNGREGFVKYFPVGLIAGISPFNFPLNLAAHKIAPAIASGCPIIAKPATTTPLSTLQLAKILSETDLPKGALSILPANREAGNQLVTDSRISLLSFTGSDTVGWKMKADSGKKKTVLELGGNAGVIISESAVMDEHLFDLCIPGAFSYSGQVCIHAQRFYVHRKHFENFVSEMKLRSEKLVFGAPEKPETEFSSMIDIQNARRVEQWIEEAVNSGAELVTGGNREKTFCSPTILVKTKPEMKVNSEEIFGPVITIEPYERFEDAVSALNNTRFGLQAGVFSSNLKEIDYAFSHIEAGGIILNDVPTLRFDHMPYGGVKDSGIGREGIRYAMFDMLEPRILVK